MKNRPETFALMPFNHPHTSKKLKCESAVVLGHIKQVEITRPHHKFIIIDCSSLSFLFLIEREKSREGFITNATKLAYPILESPLMWLSIKTHFRKGATLEDPKKGAANTGLSTIRQ